LVGVRTVYTLKAASIVVDANCECHGCSLTIDLDSARFSVLCRIGHCFRQNQPNLFCHSGRDASISGHYLKRGFTMPKIAKFRENALTPLSEGKILVAVTAACSIHKLT
jgi:hypothetical protein